MTWYILKNKIKEFFRVEDRDCECKCCGKWIPFEDCYWNDYKHKEGYCSEECRGHARFIEETGGEW